MDFIPPSRDCRTAIGESFVGDFDLAVGLELWVIMVRLPTSVGIANPTPIILEWSVNVGICINLFRVNYSSFSE